MALGQLSFVSIPGYSATEGNMTYLIANPMASNQTFQPTNWWAFWLNSPSGTLVMEGSPFTDQNAALNCCQNHFNSIPDSTDPGSAAPPDTPQVKATRQDVVQTQAPPPGREPQGRTIPQQPVPQREIHQSHKSHGSESPREVHIDLPPEAHEVHVEHAKKETKKDH